MTGLTPETGGERPFTFDDIAWQGEPDLRDSELWERNVEVVRLLLENGGVPSEIIDNSSAHNIPAAYDFNGLSVEFLPHWGFYKVGELNLGTPDDADMLHADITAARDLQAAQAAAAEYVALRSPALQG